MANINIYGKLHNNTTEGIIADAEQIYDNTQSQKQSEINKKAVAAGGYTINGKKISGNPTLAKGDVGLGNVDNTSDANKPISTATQAALDKKAPLSSPALTGTPTAPTASAGTNNTQIATTGFVQSAISSLKKGHPGGVATLDTSGKIPSSQLPGYVDDMLEFAGTVSIAEGSIQKVSLGEGTAKKVAYNSATKTFVASSSASGGTYSNNWADADTYRRASSYGTVGANGAAPATGKIYVDTTNGQTYRWSGSALVAISQSLALGETSSTAYPGDKGKAAYAHAMAKGKGFGTNLWKFATNAEGHVMSAALVTKEDITRLGIPSTNTTYSKATNSTDGLMSKEDKAKLDGISEASLIPTVSIDDLDNMIGDIDNILNGKKSSIYHVSKDGKNVGILEVVGDEMYHQITQRLYGNFSYSGGTHTLHGEAISGNLDKDSHRDGAPTTMFRIYNLSSTADTNMFPTGKWSTWYNEHIFGVRGVYTSDSALTTSEIEDAINSLG